jgi:hypothetical protein
MLDTGMITPKASNQVLMQLDGLRMKRQCSPSFGRAAWPPFQATRLY